ncbi:MAG: acylphosphatase [Phycisphaerae bacterium]
MAAPSSTDETHVRHTVLYSGRVQGVGFRYTAYAVARRFNVVGSVRNLPDGRVEILAEGPPAELTHFEEAVAEALKEHIEDTTVRESAASGEFEEFGIAF